MELIFTDHFLERVEDYTDYIALDHVPTAVEWARGVFDHCRKLSEQPESGRIVPEFGRPELRELILGS